MLGDNNFSETLITVHETTNEKGEKYLVCTAPLGKPEDTKQIAKNSSQRSGKHTYFGGY